MKRTASKDGSHLQHSFSKKNHFPPRLFNDEVLYLVPIIVRPASPEMYLVHRVFLITCRSSGRLVGYIRDKIVRSRGMVRRCIHI